MPNHINDVDPLSDRKRGSASRRSDIETALATHRPAVIDQDAFEGGLSKSRILARLREQVCVVTNNYRDSIDRGEVARVKLGEFKIAEYLDSAAIASHPRAMISEERPPKYVVEALNLPETLQPKRESRLFVGRQGCVSDLHCDWFSHWLCHIPIDGEKHIVLLPPGSGAKISAKGNLSSLHLRDYDDRQRSALIGECAGVEYDIEPGRILLMPPFWWHHFSYTTNSIALSIGIGPVDEYIQNFIVDKRMPRVSVLAAVYDEMIRAAPLQPKQRALFDVVRDEWTAKPMRHTTAFAALAEARASLR